MFDWFKDGVNPRGPEYGATARAAREARRSARATEDMLELELAADRNAAANRIMARRSNDARRRAWWHRLDNLLALAFVAALAWIIFAPASTPPQSAAMRDAIAHTSTAGRVIDAPASQAQAPDMQGNDDPAAVEKRGLAVLHDSGLTDEQIEATPAP